MGMKILVAMDESENAMRAIDYILKAFSRDNEIVLFNVIMDTEMICNMYSPELTPYFQSEQAVFCSLEDKKKELVETALESAKGRLVAEGFDESRVTIKMEIKKRGIARDIIDEAQNGYDTIMIGRRGISGLKEFFMGSVSHKVVDGIKEQSIILVN